MTAEESTPQEEANPDFGTVALRITLPQRFDQPALFSNHAVVNVTPTEVVLTFAQALLPPYLGAADLASALGSNELSGRIVAQIVMPTAKFAELIDNLATMVEGLRQQNVFPKAAERS